jgi:hypothetical protein
MLDHLSPDSARIVASQRVHRLGDRPAAGRGLETDIAIEPSHNLLDDAQAQSGAPFCASVASTCANCSKMRDLKSTGMPGE